jgi:tetratricopeptide (TPR) repeat protein
MNLHFVKKYFILALLATSAILLLEGCSTKKNTWSRRTYHNLTSRYNVYWNGNESLKTGVNDLRKSVVDDYSQILRVFNYGTKSDALKLNASMERTLEKGAIGVQKHSMYFRGRELVRWIDDSYLMMGKAHFYKQDYISARRTFEFVGKQYSYNDITNTADLWLARTYIQLEQYEKALPLLESLQAKRRDLILPAEVIQNLSLVLADYHIVRGNFQNAMPHLERGIKETRNKHDKTRAIFILAQIHQQNGNSVEAIKYYTQVVKSSASYDMAFEARINMARAYDSSTGDSKQIIKVLQKMLNDSKNIDYLDKIYFALAEIALEDKDEDLAMEYLRKSVASSTKNKLQQAFSSLKIAAMLFERSEYVPSQAYYDTAVSALPREYPGYDSIRNKSTILTDLVFSLNTVQLQDSLLKLAYMDSTSRNAIIDGIIKKIIEEERKREEEEREMERNVMMANQFGDRGANLDQSKEWYFYNPNTLGFGYTEFLRKWGRRKLEDNWRISDKQSISFETIESIALDGKAGGPAAGDSAAVVYTEKDKGYYLQDIPLTEESQEAALFMIEEALNNLGYIYKERLEDYPRSQEAYAELLRRFPESEFRLQAWYALYKMLMEQQKEGAASQYRQLILENYPNTDYARVLEDPDYFIKKAAVAGESLSFYEQTMDAYRNEEYFRVFLNSNRARTLYANDVDLMPRFDFLRAVAKGRLEIVDSMAVALSELVKTYPESDVAPLAASILRNMNKEFNMNIEIPEIPGDTAAEPETVSPYIFEKGAKHLVMIIASNEKVRTDPLRVRLSDFNERSFKSAQLMVKSLVLDEQRMLVTIGNFNSSSDADDYRMAVTESEYVFGGINAADFKVYPVSLTNYPVFYRIKDTSEYEKFWLKFYQK